MCVSGALGAKLSQSIHRNPGSLCIYEVATLCPFHLFANRLYCYSPHGHEYIHTHAVLGPYNATTKRSAAKEKSESLAGGLWSKKLYPKLMIDYVTVLGSWQPQSIVVTGKRKTPKLTVPAILRCYSEWNLSTNIVVILYQSSTTQSNIEIIKSRKRPKKEQ